MEEIQDYYSIYKDYGCFDDGSGYGRGVASGGGDESDSDGDGSGTAFGFCCQNMCREEREAVRHVVIDGFGFCLPVVRISVGLYDNGEEGS